MKLTIRDDLLREMLNLAENSQPNEVILLLRGHKKNNVLLVTEYLFPPLGIGGNGFASFHPSMLPIDFTIIGTAHSHPSGNTKPSLSDFHNFYGRVMLIMGKPYNLNNVSAHNKKGEEILIEII
jgi:proteasome lid subunit RPN8/RPN11